MSINKFDCNHENFKTEIINQYIDQDEVVITFVDICAECEKNIQYYEKKYILDTTFFY